MVAACEDPRSFDPDLQEDSILWSMLLRLAYEDTPPQDGEDDDVENGGKPLGLYNALYLLRCDGITLQPNRRWGYVLQPVIDERGDCGWQSREAYQAEARRLLDPHREKLLELLGLLGKIMKPVRR